MRTTTARQYWGILNTVDNAFLTRSHPCFWATWYVANGNGFCFPHSQPQPQYPWVILGLGFWVLGVEIAQSILTQTASQPAHTLSLIKLQSRLSPPVQHVDFNAIERRYVLFSLSSRHLKCRHVTQVADHFTLPNFSQCLPAMKIEADACLALPDVPGPPT